MWIGFYFSTQGIKQKSISAFLKNIQKLIQEVLTNICSVVYNKKYQKRATTEYLSSQIWDDGCEPDNACGMLRENAAASETALDCRQ